MRPYGNLLARVGVFFALLLNFALAGAAEQEDFRAPVEKILHGDLVGRLNPDSIAAVVGGFRRRVYQRGDSGMASSYIQGGASVTASPAEAQTSAHLEWQPAPFATLRLQYDFYGFFGENGALLSFPSKDSKFGRGEVDALAGREEAATGHRLLFQPTFAAKAGGVILRNQTDLAYYRFDGKGPFFLEWEYDTLLKDGDLLLANRSQALVAGWSGKKGEVLYTGPFYEVVHGADARLTRQRVGIQALWLPAAGPGRLSLPRIYGQAGTNLQDRNRRGEFFLTLGAGFDMNL